MTATPNLDRARQILALLPLPPVPGEVRRWNPADHPRDPDGKFGNGFGGSLDPGSLPDYEISRDDRIPGAVVAPAAPPVAAAKHPGRTPARQTSPTDWAADPELDAAIEAQRTRWQGTRSSPVLAAVWERTGFDAKPEVMERAEFDALPAGYRKFYRGISDPPGGAPATELAEQYRSGPNPFPGLGVYGHGTYAAANRQTAAAYADPGGAGNTEAPTSTQGGAVLEFALRPDAKLFDVKKPEHQDEMDRWRDQLRRKNGKRATVIATDIGTAASAMGYDAMTVRNPFNSTAPEYLVVLNRSAVIVAGGDLRA